MFSGSFDHGCHLVRSKRLLSMILYGPNLTGSVNDSQACLTLAQLLIHNCKKRKESKTRHTRHILEREPPLPLYIGLSLHTQTRSKKLVDQMAKLGISCSYDHVIQVENSLAVSICEQYKYDGIVCPPQLRKGLFTIGALDNVDHNPSSTTAQGSFHCTSISIIQQPTQEIPGTIRNMPHFLKTDKHTSKPQLMSLSQLSI